MKEKTYEGTKKTQNGLKRMFFSVLAILLQAVFMVYMFTRLNEYAAAINTTKRPGNHTCARTVQS